MLNNKPYFSVKTFLITTVLSVGLIAVSYNKQTVAQVANDLFAEDSSRVAGITSLMTAVYSNDIEGVKFFSKGGAAAVNQKNIGGATALHIAAREGNFDAAALLIESGADLNSSDNEGWTPLMRAASSGSFDIMNLMLQKGANFNLLNSQNETALVHSAISNCNECLDLIVKKYDLSNLPNIKSVLDQVDQAFVIIKNHSNEVSLKIISDFKDALLKVSPINLPKQDVENVSETYELVTPPSSSDKTKSLKFKLVGAEQSDNKESNFKIVSVKEEPVVSIEEEKKPSVTEVKPSISRKFKLVKTEESAANSTYNSQNLVKSDSIKEANSDATNSVAALEQTKVAQEKKKKFKLLTSESPNFNPVYDSSVVSSSSKALEVEKVSVENSEVKTFKDIEKSQQEEVLEIKPKKKFSFKTSQ